MLFVKELMNHLLVSAEFPKLLRTLDFAAGHNF